MPTTDDAILKTFLADVKNACGSAITITNRVRRAFKHFDTATLNFAIEIVEARPHSGHALRWPELLRILREAEAQIISKNAGLPERNTPEWNDLANKIARARVLVSVPPHEMNRFVMDVHAGNYDAAIIEYEEAALYTNNGPHGEDWKANKAYFVEKTKHLPGHSSGQKIGKGQLIDVIGALTDKVTALPYDPSKREPGAYTPTDRKRYETDS